MDVTVIKQGNFKVDGDKNFAYLEINDESKSIKLAIQPFIITTQKDVFLLDAGLGFLEDNQPVVLKCLQENRIEVNSITKILISHLHKDHTDGLGYFQNEAFIQNFPNATIYIQKREFHFALQQTKSPSYNIELLKELQTLPNIIWLNEDEGNITPEVSFKVTGAHSKFHQVFWINESDTTVFYGADDLPTNGYLKRPIAFKTDYDGHKAMELRKIWEQQAKENHWRILLYHDLTTPFIQF